MAGKCSVAGAVVSWITLWLASSVVLAQPAEFDFGKREYSLHCAACHGLAGKGDGPYNQTRTRPSDLTVLAKANRGRFPFERVREVIDGRQAIEAHGTRDMPIWGSYYGALKDANGSGSKESEPYVQTRINALVAYIYRLQEK